MHPLLHPARRIVPCITVHRISQHRKSLRNRGLSSLFVFFPGMFKTSPMSIRFIEGICPRNQVSDLTPHIVDQFGAVRTGASAAVRVVQLGVAAVGFPKVNPCHTVRHYRQEAVFGSWLQGCLQKGVHPDAGGRHPHHRPSCGRYIPIEIGSDS